MWGRNLARNLAQLEALASVADRHVENAAEFGSAFAAKPVDVDTLIHDQSIDGIVIATTTPSHDPACHCRIGRWQTCLCGKAIIA